MLLRFFDKRITFWFILAFPAIPFLWAFLAGIPGEDSEPPTEWLLHPTGEFSARFLIIAMAITPLRMLFPNAQWLRWLSRRRRELGLAAFGYATLHTMFYLLDMANLDTILSEFFALGIWTGWLAFIVFVPLAITSNSISQKKMGRLWKPLQRWVYLAAVATFIHWIAVHNGFAGAFVHFVPLAFLEAYRIQYNLRRRSASISHSA